MRGAVLNTKILLFWAKNNSAEGGQSKVLNDGSFCEWKERFFGKLGFGSSGHFEESITALNYHSAFHVLDDYHPFWVARTQPCHEVIAVGFEGVKETRKAIKNGWKESDQNECGCRKNKKYCFDSRGFVSLVGINQFKYSKLKKVLNFLAKKYPEKILG